MKVVEPVLVHLQLDDNVEVIQGVNPANLGHLAGWSDRPYEYQRFTRWGQPARKAEWILKLNVGDKIIKIDAKSTKAGIDSATIKLE